MMNIKENLNKIQNYHKNPRYITQKNMSDLENWLSEFGDLGGIVVNVRTWEIISGNQRSKKINIKNAVVEYQYEVPTDQGTVGWGYVLLDSERFPIRFVDWDEQTAEKAVVIANKSGGAFDMDILNNQFDLDLLLDSGWIEEELAGILDDDFDEDGPIDKELNNDKKFSVVVNFLSETDRDTFFQELEITYANDETISWLKK